MNYGDLLSEAVVKLSLVLAVIGIVFESLWMGRFPRLSTGLYLAIGWVGIIAVWRDWRIASSFSSPSFKRGPCIAE